MSEPPIVPLNSSSLEVSRRFAWTKCSIIVIITMGLGLVNGILLAIWGFGFFLKPPLLSYTAVAHLVSISLWLPVLVTCFLLKPTKNWKQLISLIALGLVQTVASLIIAGNTIFSAIIVPSETTDCNFQPLPGRQIRYTCTVAPNAYFFQYYLDHGLPFEGTVFSPFITIVEGKKYVDIIIEQAAEENVRSLDLSFRGISQLPPEIGRLSSLERLDLSHNQLKELPPEIGQLSNLQDLNLEFNQLKELPPEIWQLKLKHLNLNENPVNESPEILQFLPLQQPYPPIVPTSVPLPPTATPAECISTGIGDTVEVLSINPPVGTPLLNGRTYVFVIKVKYQLETRNDAILETSIYSFGGEHGGGLAGDNSIKVSRGCAIRDTILVHTVSQDAQTAVMRLAVALRINEYHVLSDWGFEDPYPISH